VKKRRTNGFEDIVRNRERRSGQSGQDGDLTAAENLTVMEHGPMIEKILHDMGKAEWGRGLFLKRYDLIIPKKSISKARLRGGGVKELLWVVKGTRPGRHANCPAAFHREREEYAISVCLDEKEQVVGFTVTGAESFDTEGTDESCLMSAVRKVLTAGPDITLD